MCASEKRPLSYQRAGRARSHGETPGASIAVARFVIGERRRNCQAEQGVGRMPRGQEPTKGAESGETWMGSCKRAKSHPDPNGATHALSQARIRWGTQ